jgi:hypothetical protein
VLLLKAQMDEADILKSSGLSVGVIAIIYVVIKIVKSLNNKRLHSKCNGKDIVDVVIDVREATEEDKKPTPTLTGRTRLGSDISEAKPTPKQSPAITAIKYPSDLNLNN